MYFCYAWGSWFYFGWFPVYLVKGAGFSEKEMGLFTALPFLMGVGGNLVGGDSCESDCSTPCSTGCWPPSHRLCSRW